MAHRRDRPLALLGVDRVQVVRRVDVHRVELEVERGAAEGSRPRRGLIVDGVQLHREWKRRRRRLVQRLR
eukprot:3719850-Prymnesium_polylepis.1